MTTLKFPDNFYWGAATSAHQVEGGNHNDWTEWEIRSAKLKVQDAKLRKWPDFLLKNYPSPLQEENYISGKACDSYNRYEEDFDIAKKLNHNIHRFSIEWSRIEPEEGRFDSQAMRHYINVVKSLHGRGIEPMVTLWHFTNPIWLANKGGFLNKKSPEYFARYVRYVIENLGDKIKYWATFNEPGNMYGTKTFLIGEWLECDKNNFVKFFRLRKNFLRSHVLAYREIKKYSSDNSVGLVETYSYVVGSKIFSGLGLVGIFNYFRKNWYHVIPNLDFIGLNYYTIMRWPGSYPVLSEQNLDQEMKMEIYPEGLYKRLLELGKMKKPIFITENGIADATDQKRAKFIKDHLYWVWRAIQDGTDVRGYFYWSLLDNFEWAHGFSPRFGLVEMNYQTFERRIRPSAWEYKKICETNSLEI